MSKVTGITEDNFKGSMYDFTDPSRIGPGLWHAIHVMCDYADKNGRIAQEYTCGLLEGICKKFKCGECNGHCNHYINETDSPRRYIGVHRGLFNWSIDFRNAVQRRLGRSNLYDHKTMASIFSEDHVFACEGECGESKPKPNSINIQPDRTMTIYSKPSSIGGNGIIQRVQPITSGRVSNTRFLGPHS